MNVVDLFKNYQVHILNAAKKSEKDYIKEVFSRTELFDISNLKETVPQLIPVERGEDLVAPLPKELSLPFDSCFIQIWSDEDEHNGIFIREYSPYVLTGAAFMDYHRDKITLSTPFTIDLDRLELSIKKSDVQDLVSDVARQMNMSPITNPDSFERQMMQELNIIRFTDIARLIQLATNALDSLNKRAVMVDRCKKSEYYSFKGKPTVKVTRPIYYVLDKENYKYQSKNIKPLTKLEYSHSFRVRGHWRKMQEDFIGKDRQGERHVKGFTWIKDFVKGDGELTKRIRSFK